MQPFEPSITFRRAVRSTGGMVATKHWLASQAGVEVLRRGGNAVDAAVTIGLAVGVVEPPMSGLGGGGYMVLYLARQRRAVVIDFAMQAPAAAREDMYELDEGRDEEGFGWRRVKGAANIYGHRAVAVPGMLAGLAHALERYGTIGLDTALDPAIRLAREGYPITWLDTLHLATETAVLSRNAEAARIFLRNGVPPAPSAARPVLFRQPDLAQSLETIAAGGPRALYGGRLAEMIEQDMRAHGGLLTAEDLAHYRVHEQEPAGLTTYRGHPLLGMRGATGATSLAQLLNILEHVDLAALGHNSAEHVRLVIEASRAIWADRFARMADPRFYPMPLDELLDKSYAGRLAAAAQAATPGPTMSIGAAPTESTTHFCVCDGEGNMVSLTQTLMSLYGARIVAPGTGILLNNGMMWFDPEPGRPNSIAPGKKGLNNMCPAVVLAPNGDPLLAVGASGGRRILNCVAQLICNVVDFRMDIQEAINAPRIDTSAGIVLDARLPDHVIEVLRERGYQFELQFPMPFPRFFASPVGIQRVGGEVLGGVDPQYFTAMAVGV